MIRITGILCVPPLTPASVEVLPQPKVIPAHAFPAAMFVRFLSLHLIALGCLQACSQFALAADYQQDIVPILTTHCYRCHGPETQEGNLRLDQLSIDLTSDRAAVESWHEVLNALDAGQMPPEDEPALDRQSHETLTAWLSQSIQQALDARRDTDGRSVIRRLTRIEYQNTMRDLLDLELDYTRDLPPDAPSRAGFTNDARALQMSPMQLETYLDNARRALDRVIVLGEQPKPFNHVFTETKIDTWLGKAQRSNHLGRQQEFLGKIVNDYPDDGDFMVIVKLTADLKPNVGYPLLEVSVGYQPDTEILLDRFPLVEVTKTGEQTFEFRGRLENFPLPVRGQGKFPGLVVRIRNLYDDGSPKPEEQKDEHSKVFYADEPHLPLLHIQSVEFRGNAYETWPPARHQQILFPCENSERDSIEYVSEVLRRFMSRAFRRAVDANEVARMTEFFQNIRGEFPSFEEAMRETLAMVLIQPDFLYRLELSGEPKRAVTSTEMATRLSYFLWSTMPDEELNEFANRDQLQTPEQLIAAVDRMLSDARSSRLIEQFTSEWLGLHMLDNVAIDRKRYGQFKEDLKREMVRETQSCFAELLRNNESVLKLLDADYLMVNEPLAKHYGITGVYGQAMQRVPVASDSHRGGLLSQASFLLLNSNGIDSHPIRRAVWIRDRLLNDPPPPPPPNVPSLEQADPKFHSLSVREQLEIHRKKESCNRCHRNIDPWGMLLENYDAVGLWRDREIPNESLPGQAEIAGTVGLKHYLLDHRQRDFVTALVSRLLTYALGREIELTDEPAIKAIVEATAADNFRLKQIVHQVVLSEPFRTK